MDEEWLEMRNWLDGFDVEMKGALVLMCKSAADQTKPFAEKYEAREILETLLGEMKQSWLDKSDMMKAVKALIYNRLGQNYFDAEEISESERQMQQSLALWEQVSKALQLRFSHSLQDVYNGIGIVLANRENNAEALPYLTKAVENYEAAIAAVKVEDKAALIKSQMSLNDLDKFLLKKDVEQAGAANVQKIIHGGLELNVLEAGYT